MTKLSRRRPSHRPRNLTMKRLMSPCGRGRSEAVKSGKPARPVPASRALNLGSRAMPRTFKQLTPSSAELELLHECWLARLPPAKIAARLCISEAKLKRFMRRVHSARAMSRAEPARPRQPRHQASSSDADRFVCAHVRRMSGRPAGSHSGLARAANLAGHLRPVACRHDRRHLGLCHARQPVAVTRAARAGKKAASARSRSFSCV
jgi:hypothetical protein